MIFEIWIFIDSYKDIIDDDIGLLFVEIDLEFEVIKFEIEFW
jgi:hypothetical protein